MSSGENIIFENHADQGPDIKAGNLIFVLKERKHPFFTRKQDNLYVTLHITLKEALLGFKKTIKQLDGTDVALERQSVTQHGFVQTIEGQGMPSRKFPSERGHLYIEYRVVFPDVLDSELKKAISIAPSLKMKTERDEL